MRILMEHPKYKLHELMMHGLPKLMRLSKLLEALVGRHFPKVQTHLNNIGLDVVLYSQNWIQTLFTYTMDFETLTFVWDLFFEESWRGFLCVSLVLIKEIQHKLVLEDFETCVASLREISTNPPSNISEMARNYKLSAEDEKMIAETINFDEPDTIPSA